MHLEQLSPKDLFFLAFDLFGDSEAEFCSVLSTARGGRAGRGYLPLYDPCSGSITP
jgi:hypothetical protein